MTSFIRSLCIAALLAAGSAWAQQPVANPDNTHSTQAKDKASSNPDSRDREKGTSMDGHMAGDVDHEAMMKNATPQQQLQKLHMADLQEIEMAKLADQNGTDRIRSYAQTLQRDHQAADKQLMDLAKRKGFTLTDTPKDAQKQQHMQMKKEQLSNLQGAQFDRAFANTMAMDHRKVISLAQAWKQDCKDRDVCSLIDSLLPTLQQHLTMAEQLRGPPAQGRAPDSR